MGQVHVLDDYYLAITLLITIAYQLFFFSIAWTLHFDKLTDFAGGTNFVVLAIITLSLSGSGGHDASARQIVASLFMMLWGARLSGFLLFRIIKTGSDDRFDDKRDHFFAFLGFWVFQMLWVWTTSLPVTIINSPAVSSSGYGQPAFGTGCDIAGVILWTLGFVMESVSDVQKYRFRSRSHAHNNNNDRSSSSQICDVGFFAWTRHPNYFGEILMQFSIFTLTISPSAYSHRGYIPRGTGASAAQYASILGPIFLTVLLMFVSGLPLQERPGAKKRYEQGDSSERGGQWSAYQRYLHRTSILIPFPPQLYAPLPTIVKRTLFLEFPIYVFDPAKHADDPDKVIREREAREAEEGRQQQPPPEQQGASEED